jgi:YidC/Oxa1 family membrane protein insertase
MLPTEVQRILLLIGLAATAYMLILAWNEDYLQQPAAVQFAPEPELEDGSGPVAPPSAPAEAAISDVPDASLLDDVPVAPVPAPVEAPTGARLVKVSTPTLEVWIDRHGGDIVQAQLPGHLLDLGGDIPFRLLNRDRTHTYIAQSGLFGPDGIDSGGSRPQFESGRDEYVLSADAPMVVELTARVDGMDVVKAFEFQPDDYLVNVSYRIVNGRDQVVRAALFAQIKRDDREGFGEKPMFLGPRPYLGAALTTTDSRYKKLSFDDVRSGEYRTEQQGGWIAFLQHYFLSAWVANPDETNRFFGRRHPDGTYIFGYSGPVQAVAPGATGEWTSRFYVGPKDQRRLEQIAPNLNLTVDYGFLWWLADPLFRLLDWMYSLSGNWGLAIILLTVLVKLVLYPLSAASYRSMANMRRVAPQMKRLQERYADDRQKLSQEMMALYKKEKVNPLGGCLPMLLPMPIFIALYWVLFESVELRHAPFMFWIKDLSAMDPFFILPLLMGASMYVMQLLAPAVGDPMQQRMMRLMPIMFTVLFLFFPAGLVLYWLVNNVLSLAQQWYVMRQYDAKHAAKA